MRSITKGAEPRALIRWKADNVATPQNLVYGGGGFPGEKVRESLLAEQFHLCAYTMKRLATAETCGQDFRASCHIEHVLPQARGIPAETIDYQNMLACYPPSQTKVACEYGAQAKAEYDPAMHPCASPLQTNVQQHFKFGADGAIEGITAQGIATVGVLKLDHKILVNDRAAIVRGFLCPKGTEVSAAHARRIAIEVLKPDANHCLSPHCTAVAAIALLHADRLERRASRLKGKN